MSLTIDKLVLASNNKGKIKEIKEILDTLSLDEIDILTLQDFDYIGEIKETGRTFEENARLKAETVSQKTGLLALADDSGLEVYALDGKPGVYSARFVGEKASDEENNKKLLNELEGVPWEKREGQFKCVIALSHPKLKPRIVEGTCQGYILEEEKGEGGFGYDPLFYYPKKDKTFAELTSEEKSKVSHRGRALSNLAPVLKEVIKTLEFLEGKDENCSD